MGPGILQPLERLRGTRASRPEGLGASWDSLVLNSRPFLASGKTGRGAILKEGKQGRLQKPQSPPFMRVKDFKMATAES